MKTRHITSNPVRIHRKVTVTYGHFDADGRGGIRRRHHSWSKETDGAHRPGRLGTSRLAKSAVRLMRSDNIIE